MASLLTFGVLAFQLAIVITVVSASRFGRREMRLVTACWVLFTLFGSIFTAGLLLLQLLTIFVSYGVGARNLRTRHAVTQNVRPATKAVSNNSSRVWVFIFLLVAFWFVGKHLGRESANRDFERLQGAREVNPSVESRPTKSSPVVQEGSTTSSKAVAWCGRFQLLSASDAPKPIGIR
jgi:hypothetical protein